MTYITRTRAEVYQLWIDALRSGKYKQTDSRLRDTNAWLGKDRRGTGFCCLGVLCDLAIKDGGLGEWDEANGPKSLSPTPPPAMLRWLGLDNDMTNHLINLNDDHGKTFKQIAKVIEEDIMPAVL
jgi:hypothetical protein